jgi:prepilin-type N-terminal cleavage/methylation domain-containing protein
LEPQRSRSRQSGFTLVEFAIVLVVSGLIVGSAMTGRELVALARAKTLANELQSIRLAIVTYQDRFHAMPGDDPFAAERLAGAQAAPGAGNGVIDGLWTSTAPTEESALLWQHLRLAGLLPALRASDTADPRPLHFLGGRYGVSGAVPYQRQVEGLMGSFQLCASAIPGRLAKVVDRQVDDGDTAKGSMRIVPDGAPVGTPAVETANVDDGAAYTLCQVF